MKKETEAFNRKIALLKKPKAFQHSKEIRTEAENVEKVADTLEICVASLRKSK